MRFRAVLTSAIVLGAVGAGSAMAEMNLNGPAEVPPASYSGRQYVDSAGCVFVRAGYGSAVNWVPRIDRGRKQLCGYKPTLAEGSQVLHIAKTAPEAAAPAPTPAVAPKLAAPVAAPAPAPRVAAKPAVPAAPMRTASVAAPATSFARPPFAGAPMPTIALTTTPPRIGRAAVAPVAAPAALPAPVMTPAAPVAAAPAPSRSGYVSPYTYAGGRLAPLPLPGEAPASIAPTMVAPVMMAAAAPSILRSETIAAPAACPNGASVAQRYYLSDGRRVLRCSAETADPVGFINGAGLPGLQVAGLGPRAPEAVAMMPASYTAPSYTAPARGPVLVGGTGYSVTRATHGLAPAAAMTGGLTPQQSYARQSPYQAQGYAPQEVRLRTPAGQTLLAPVAVSSKDYQSGFKPAFDDGRLNPYRGPRNAMSDATMGAIWTNQVPARLVTPQTPARQRIKVPQAALAQGLTAPVETVIYGTKSAPAVAAPRAALAQPKAQSGAQPAAGARYVQVGSFGVPANAEAAKARLRAAGLPVSSGAAGKLTVVYAGPVPGAEAARALAAVRAAGFGDAYLR